ncbi:DNA cytosine methyltransferase [Burkholderia ambifaria]|nr:DNA cytosine methyltransferase [Burkholderia ambifaria]
MLGEGVRAAFEYFGIEHRTVCYVEREASAAGQLVALMEAGALDEAPVWSDLLTFDGAAWRGRVDSIVAGFPCQDLSVAGRRAGLDGQRSGLFFRVVDIADHCGAWLLVLENVSGIASATATVVDEAGDVLEERAASRVVGELADRGWNAEWTHVRASDVGASHQRERWFCVAWRDGASDVGAGGARVGDAACDGWGEGRPESAGQCGRSDAAEHGGAVGDPECSERRPVGVGGHSGEPGQDGERQASSRARIRDEALGAPASVDGDEWDRLGQRVAASTGCESGAEGSGVAVGHPDEQRQQQPHDEDGAEPRERAWEGAGGAGVHVADSGCVGRWCESHSDSPSAGVDWSSGELFAPGPVDDRWPGIIADRPDLAPAVEPGVRVLVDGVALLVDESRNHQLRQVGNGVVPLQVATALVALLRRAGFRVRRDRR